MSGSPKKPPSIERQASVDVNPSPGLSPVKLKLKTQQSLVSPPLSPLKADRSGSPTKVRERSPSKVGEKKVEFSDPLVLEKPSPIVVQEAPKPELDPKKTMQFIEARWKKWFIKGLKDYVRVPVSTPKVDPDFCLN